MSFCIKSTQVWVFPARSRNGEKLFPLTCRGGAKEELSCHENVMRMLLCVSLKAQFGSHHKSIFLIDSSIELYVKWSPGTMSR